MVHIDLFSGIAGFSLAVDAVWKNVKHIFCDNDPFCQQLLKLRYPNSKIYGDIRELIAYTRSGKQRGLSGIKRKEVSEIRKCHILTGGFPCQPFSQAGPRKGTEDNRYLWPEMFEVIQLTQPKWIIAENVGGLVTWNEGMVLEQVCADLENENYEVQSLIIPACAKNAPHRRDRIWIVGNCDKQRLSGRSKNRESSGKRTSRKANSNDSNTECQRQQKSKHNRNAKNKKENSAGMDDRFERQNWNKNWLEVATELCGVDDGLPAELDGLKLSKSKHRVERIKSLGNAIVPQVAIEIMKAIKESEK